MGNYTVSTTTGCGTNIVTSGSVNSKGQTVTTESFKVGPINTTITKVEGPNGEVDIYIDKSMDTK